MTPTGQLAGALAERRAEGRIGYRVDELAAALGVSRRTIERRIKDGTLKSTRALGVTLVSAESVAAIFGGAR